MTRIEAIKQRVAAATPAPWQTNDIHEIFGPERSIEIGQAYNPQDAYLIAHAPQDLRDLLGVVEKAIKVRNAFYNLPDADNTPLNNAIAELDLTLQAMLNIYFEDSPVGDEGAK